MGGQTALSHEDELSIVRCLELCGDWGYALSHMDVRIFIKMHLNRIGLQIPAFKNGDYPGREWWYSFVNRYKDRGWKIWSQ